MIEAAATSAAILIGALALFVSGRVRHDLVALLALFATGDAAAALRRLAISGEVPTVDSLIRALATECRYKAPVLHPIGFMH